MAEYTNSKKRTRSKDKAKTTNQTIPNLVAATRTKEPKQ